MSHKLAERLEEERRECAGALLNRPWIAKDDDPELFQRIKAHYDWLRDWFRETCGFPLLLTRTFVKLEKVPEKAYSWMGIESFSHPRDYGLLMYALWFLEGKGEHEQFLLSDLAEEVRDHLLTEQIDCDWRNYYHRLAMARALRQLRDWSVLIALDGEENEWAQNSEQNVLYECSTLVRYVVRRFTHDVTSCDKPEQLAVSQYPETEAGRRERLRHRVYRRLLQEPVVLDAEWSDEERQYVLTQRRSIIERLRQIGFEAVRYREGLLVTYPEASGDLALFPSPQGISDICLRLACTVRQRLLDPAYMFTVEEDGRVSLSWSELEQLLYELKEQDGAYWGKKHREASSTQLARETANHLFLWKLAVPREGGVFLEPTFGRWEAMYPERDVEGR